MAISFEEVLQSEDLPDDLKPVLVYREMLEYEKYKLVFLAACEVHTGLIGEPGEKLRVGYVYSIPTATTITEDELHSTGKSPGTITIKDVDVDIGDIIYAATQIADQAMEDLPQFDLIQVAVRELTYEVKRYIDAAIRDLLIAGAGNTQTATTAGTLALRDVFDAEALMSEDHYFVEDNGGLIFIHPREDADLRRDATFDYSKDRYTIPTIRELGQAHYGRIGGFAVVKTDNMIKGLALLVQPKTRYGPAMVHAIKKRLTVITNPSTVGETAVLKERSTVVAETRTGQAVVRANAIALISNC